MKAEMKVEGKATMLQFENTFQGLFFSAKPLLKGTLKHTTVLVPGIGYLN